MKISVFASVLNDQIARLGIPEACNVLNISRRTLEFWRYGKPPRLVIQVGALAILADAASAAPCTVRPLSGCAMPTPNAPDEPRGGDNATPLILHYELDKHKR